MKSTSGGRACADRKPGVYKTFARVYISEPLLSPDHSSPPPSLHTMSHFHNLFQGGPPAKVEVRDVRMDWTPKVKTEDVLLLPPSPPRTPPPSTPRPSRPRPSALRPSTPPIQADRGGVPDRPRRRAGEGWFAWLRAVWQCALALCHALCQGTVCLFRWVVWLGQWIAQLGYCVGCGCDWLISLVDGIRYWTLYPIHAITARRLGRWMLPLMLFLAQCSPGVRYAATIAGRALSMRADDACYSGFRAPPVLFSLNATKPSSWMSVPVQNSMAWDQITREDAAEAAMMQRLNLSHTVLDEWRRGMQGSGREGAAEPLEYVCTAVWRRIEGAAAIVTGRRFVDGMSHRHEVAVEYGEALGELLDRVSIMLDQDQALRSWTSFWWRWLEAVCPEKLMRRIKRSREQEQIGELAWWIREWSVAREQPLLRLYYALARAPLRNQMLVEVLRQMVWAQHWMELLPRNQSACGLSAPTLEEMRAWVAAWPRIIQRNTDDATQQMSIFSIEHEYDDAASDDADANADDLFRGIADATCGTAQAAAGLALHECLLPQTSSARHAPGAVLSHASPFAHRVRKSKHGHEHESLKSQLTAGSPKPEARSRRAASAEPQVQSRSQLGRSRKPPPHPRPQAAPASHPLRKTLDCTLLSATSLAQTLEHRGEKGAERRVLFCCATNVGCTIALTDCASAARPPAHEVRIVGRMRPSASLAHKDQNIARTSVCNAPIHNHTHTYTAIVSLFRKSIAAASASASASSPASPASASLPLWHWPAFANDPRHVTNDTLAQEADQHLLQLSTFSPRYSIPWLMDIYHPIPFTTTAEDDLPAYRHVRPGHISYGAAFAFTLKQRNCEAFRALRHTRRSQALTDELDDFSWLDNLSTQRCTLQFKSARQLLSSLHCLYRFLARHLYLVLKPADYSHWVKRAQILGHRQRHALSPYLDRSPDLFNQHQRIRNMTTTYRSKVTESLDVIAFRIVQCHRQGPEAPCRAKFVPDIEALYRSKAWVDWLDLNALVSYQRMSAMSFFALQMRDTLDRLMRGVKAEQTDFVALVSLQHSHHSLINFIHRLNQPTSNGPTLLHTLGYRAGLYASKHWAHRHDKARTRNPSSHQLTFPPNLEPAPFSSDFLTCLWNLGKAISVSNNNQSTSSDPPITCPLYLSLQRNKNWVFQYFSQLTLSSSPSSPSSPFELPVPEPLEPVGDDWNCEAPQFEGAMPLSGKGLRMGNTEFGRLREWEMFKRQSNGERCVVWEDEENGLDGYGFHEMGGGDGVWCLVDLPWEKDEEGMGKEDGVWGFWRSVDGDREMLWGNETLFETSRERFRKGLCERRREEMMEKEREEKEEEEEEGGKGFFGVGFGELLERVEREFFERVGGVLEEEKEGREKKAFGFEEVVRAFFGSIGRVARWVPRAEIDREYIRSVPNHVPEMKPEKKNIVCGKAGKPGRAETSPGWICMRQ
ncbi:uncharacterized protein MYCFIDRAFT_179693 [Pseudocercospora fijiensis CIRAD86]|uniref:Uncharacterized protein n=1 Tax=Pseudocercospora fijiensis (strain CIRAD86) TaxID=383855 RepID=M3AJ24_PSEFD|nr:uncharacterized protein MYCFIDRAFT_179693 [Pseudocercospora fijiensis CIRAD86]EME77482.1 hypothetical protein MYCFIDRAFT_179693 [Pseudocercospora fijiensis CIRAD86]